MSETLVVVAAALFLMWVMWRVVRVVIGFWRACLIAHQEKRRRELFQRLADTFYKTRGSSDS